MADYNSSYTGQQIDSAVAKATKLPTTSSGDSGKTLQVDSSGNFVANSVSGGGTQLYSHHVGTRHNDFTIISPIATQIIDFETFGEVLEECIVSYLEGQKSSLILSYEFDTNIITFQFVDTQGLEQADVLSSSTFNDEVNTL